MRSVVQLYPGPYDSGHTVSSGVAAFVVVVADGHPRGASLPRPNGERALDQHPTPLLALEASRLPRNAPSDVGAFHVLRVDEDSVLERAVRFAVRTASSINGRPRRRTRAKARRASSKSPVASRRSWYVMCVTARQRRLQLRRLDRELVGWFSTRHQRRRGRTDNYARELERCVAWRELAR